MPSSRRALNPTPPWWEVWASLTALVALGILIFRVLVVKPFPLHAIDAVLMIVAYLGVAVELVRGLVQRTR